MTDPLFAIARITPRPEHLDAARAAILGILDDTRAEPGCHRFDLLEGRGDGCLYLYEAWEDEAALAAHYAQPYTADVFARYEAWLAEPVEIHHLRKLA